MKVLSVPKKSVLGIVILCGLSACGRSSAGTQTEFTPGKFEMPFPEACMKPEAEQTISPEAKQNAFLLEEEIEVQDMEYVDCDGKLLSKDHGPIRSFNRLVTVEAPASIAQDVTAIEIENPRTCMKVQATTEGANASGKVKVDDMTEVDLTKARAANSLTTFDKTGRLSLAVSDTPLQVIPWQLSLADGANAIQIRYYGRCLETQPDDKTKCARAELLATKEALLTLKLTHQEIPGVKPVRLCEADEAIEKDSAKKMDQANQD
jgi:hypothetical protein